MDSSIIKQGKYGCIVSITQKTGKQKTFEVEHEGNHLQFWIKNGSSAGMLAEPSGRMPADISGARSLRLGNRLIGHSQMTKRLALVTGGTTGIGAAICKALKVAGFDVAVNYIANKAKAEAFAKGIDVSAYQWDVSDFDQCAKGTAKVCADFGTNVDILVNNAGITRDVMLHKMTLEDWDAVISVDLGACFNMCRAVIGNMRDKEFGRIISISSINAQLGQIGQTNYSAAKSGIIGLTKSLARESATKGITVNTVAPGYTDTTMLQTMPDDVLKAMIAQVPIGRLALPEEIARAVVFLAADESAFITGHTLCVNGGHYMQ
jgi:acetoacetyl-CoA reductase